MPTQILTHRRLVEMLHYCPQTGDFTWLKSAQYGPRVEGRQAGSRSTRYAVICIDGVKYKAHRLAWFYTHGIMPQQGIDHKDGNRFNNAIDNLREATQAQNCANACLIKGKKLPKGVRQSGKNYTARISFQNKLITIGTFPTINAASAAYFAKAQELYGEFARME